MEKFHLALLTPPILSKGAPQSQVGRPLDLNLCSPDAGEMTVAQSILRTMKSLVKMIFCFLTLHFLLVFLKKKLSYCGCLVFGHPGWVLVLDKMKCSCQNQKSCFLSCHCLAEWSFENAQHLHASVPPHFSVKMLWRSLIGVYTTLRFWEKRGSCPQTVYLYFKVVSLYFIEWRFELFWTLIAFWVFPSLVEYS